MSFVTFKWFRAQMSKPAIMDFIARTPQEYYLLIPEGIWTYGVAASEDVLELLCNEFKVDALEMITANEVRTVANKTGARQWGNSELLSG